MIDPAVTGLIAVDVQADFLPGGALGVPGADAVVAPICELASHVGVVVASRDFHPPGHCSFIFKGGPWPPHCVIGSPGAALHPDIDAIAHAIVSKGTDPAQEQYSGFDGTGLGALLRARGVQRVIIGGLATDYCVRATALAACGEGFATTIVLDAVRAVDVHPGDGDRALEDVRAAGGRVCSLAEILGEPPLDSAAGHRILPHTADLILEAWARDRNSCIEQAVLALVESFVDSHDVAPSASSTRHMPAAEDAERLVAVLEEAIYIVDTRGAVPVRATITDEPDGGLRAVFGLVPLGQVEVIGPAPKGIARHGLLFSPGGGEWRCHVVVDV
ncbi:MAG: archease [Candidatus Dormiibacterota bacterium]